MGRGHKTRLARRWIVIASLIVLASLIGGLAFYMECLYSNYRMEYEGWLRLHRCRYINVRWNFKSATEFNVGYKGDLRVLTLQRGKTGSIELVIKSDLDNTSKLIGRNLYGSCDLSPYGTIDGSGFYHILPPGISIEFTPSSITLPAGRSVSVLQTITADPDAPIGQYIYFGSIYNWDSSDSFWLVIGPYTPHGNFSLVEGREDFIARDEINVTREIDWQTLAYWQNLSWDFMIRSEGPPLNVTLEFVNVDLPEGVKLPGPQQVFVPAGSQVSVNGDNIGPYDNWEPDRTYRFKVIAKSGNEVHVANFEISVY